MLSKLSLRLEIILLLLVKATLLFLIWKFCFSHPLDESFVASDVEQHVFTSNPLT
jgi:hypothetical protein